MVVEDRRGLTGERGCVAGRLLGAGGEQSVEAGVRAGLAGDLKVTVADHVEQDHRPDLGQRRRALPSSGSGVVDVLAAAAGAIGFEGSARSRLLGVEEDEVDRRARGPARKGLGKPEHHRHPGGAVVGADEAFDPALGVVVGADDDRPGLGARDRPEHVRVRPLHADALDPGVAQAAGDQPRGALGRRRPRGARADRDLSLDVGQSGLAVELAAGRRRPPVGAAAEGEGRDGGGQRVGDPAHRWREATLADCAGGVGFAHGTGAHGPSQRARQSFLTNESSASHMHVGAVAIFEGPPPTTPTCSTMSARGFIWCPASARSWPFPRRRPDARSGSTTPPSTSPTTSATRRCPHPARRSSFAAWRGGSSRSSSTGPSRFGSCGWCRG